MKTKIYVRQHHIRKGKNNKISNTECPVALAIRRIPGLRHVEVGVDTAWSRYDSTDGTFEGLITLPKRASNFIRRMIREQKLTPFTFYLTAKQVKTLQGEL